MKEILKANGLDDTQVEAILNSKEKKDFKKI